MWKVYHDVETTTLFLVPSGPVFVKSDTDGRRSPAAATTQKLPTADVRRARGCLCFHPAVVELQVREAGSGIRLDKCLYVYVSDPNTGFMLT